MIDFGPICIVNLVPILHSPVPMSNSPIISSLPTLCLFKKRSFVFHHSSHPSSLQVLTNFPCRKRLIDDVNKWFCDLSLIISLPRAKKVNSILSSSSLVGHPPKEFWSEKQCLK